jgi:hypothetical protein
MNKKNALMVLFFAVFALTSCTIQIADRPEYYKDYDDKASAAEPAVYNNYYSIHYAGSAAPVPTVMPTAALAEVVVINYITLRVTGNTYYFYEGDREAAVWIFGEDGNVIKKGKTINGLVKRFYDGTSIVESEIPYKNGERWGACKKFYPNGLLKETISYSAGDRAGAYKAYYPNGRVMEEGGYKKGKMDGNYKRYLETGELQEHGNYSGKSHRIIYVKPTPTPVAVPTAVPAEKEESERYNDKHVAPEDQGKWHGEKEVITVVVTPARDAADPSYRPTRIVKKERDEASAYTTVVVTATPQIIPTQAATRVPEVIEGNHDRDANRPDWVQEKKDIKNVIKDDRKESKQDVKDFKQAVSEVVKADKEDAKEVLTEKMDDVKEVAGDAAENTSRVVVPLKIKSKVNRAGIKKAEAEASDGAANTDEAKSEVKSEGHQGKEKSADKYEAKDWKEKTGTMNR